MENKAAVFVYGTLRRHLPNYRLLENAELIAAQCWTYGRLYDTGDGYPAMVPTAATRVYGEVYLVAEAQLKQLDQLEGYRGKDLANDYDRIVQEIHTDREAMEAYVYVYRPEQVKGMESIEHGDWKYHLLKLQPSIRYFAYGSMMDDERLLHDGVGYMFQRLAGRGIVRGYSLKFTRKAADGGRADIVEEGRSFREGSAGHAQTGKYVEGKVFSIDQDGLAYLEAREGVDRGAYRPTFVDLEFYGRIVPDVLTFVVVDKAEETAPPQWYAEEIIRGARRVVSAAYLGQLKRKFRDDFGLQVDTVRE